MSHHALVKNPNHYQQFDKEVKDIIRYTLGEEGYRYYCQGCELKYRLRFGFKPGFDYTLDTEKALEYNRMRLEVSDATPSDKD